MIALERVRARAGGFELHDITFAVPSGGWGVVIGPAGSGKTTLLETIAGLLPATAGRVIIHGEDHTRTPPEHRGLGIVYQHGYLFPHLSVRENIAYGAVDRATADDLASRFGVAALSDRSVASLSGGERQLVAAARALARRPKVLLLDEPFSALDPRSRIAARRALRALHAHRAFTVLQVTHDFSEAGSLGDLAMVLDGGRLVQQGPPEDVFRKPATPFIADFLGAENVFAGTVSEASTDDETAAVEFTTGALTFYAVGVQAGSTTHAVLRAEEVVLSTGMPATSMRNHFGGRIADIVFDGALAHVTVDVRGTPIVAAITARSARELALAEGHEVVVSFKATALHLC